METELNEIPVMLVRAEGGATGAKDAYLNQPPFHAKLRRESFAEDFALRWHGFWASSTALHYRPLNLPAGSRRPTGSRSRMAHQVRISSRATSATGPI